MEKLRATLSTNIQFVNDDGNWDETQFDTHDEKELACLFWEFMKENGFITYDRIVADYVSGTPLYYWDELSLDEQEEIKASLMTPEEMDEEPETKTAVITSPDEMIDKVFEEYRKYDSELCSLHFNFDVKMKKSDILEAYAEIQRRINGDDVVRIENGKEADELIPDDPVYDEIYSGNLMEYLESFNGNKEFVRIVENEISSFIF